MKLRSKLFYSYLFLLVVYAGFTLLPAPSGVTLALYHLSSLELKLISASIVIIMAGIWFAGFYGYAKLHKYSENIKGDKDGKHVKKISQGILVLALWLPVSFTISAVLSYIALKNPSTLAATTIIKNYINILIPLIGFILVGMGANGLSEITKSRPSYRTTNLLALFIVYIGLIYYRLLVTTPSRADIYHMSIWPIALTLAAPYIFMWFIGLLATYEIYSYQKKVVGVVYRESWRWLSLGLAWLILSSMALQYLTTLSARLTDLSIYGLLAVVYSMLLMLAVGFVLIALGTKKLQRIEEV